MVTSSPDQSLSSENLNVGEKVPLNDNAMMDKTGTPIGPIPEETGKAGSSSTDAEMLVRALRNVITPLVRPAGGENKCDTNESGLGSDGEVFVVALQKFMLSFLCTHRGPVNSVEVELGFNQGTEMPNTAVLVNNTSENNLSPAATNIADVPPDTEALPDKSSLSGDITSQEESTVRVHSEEPIDGSEVAGIYSAVSGHTDTSEQERQLLFEKAKKALREHIFNVMPIRLLHFKRHDSKLRITLIERGAMYAIIVPTVKATIYNSDSFPPHVTNSWGGRETNEEAIIAVLIRQSSRYAILSHTWLRSTSGEVTYGDWNEGKFNSYQPGYQKLLNFCKTAWKDHSVVFGWMDTVCINKESSAELDESIRSMFKWYSNAHVCITYLAETVELSDMHHDTWFTRGWTLQELIAPSHVKFYNIDWNKLGKYPQETDKKDLFIQKQIEKATTITASELSNLSEAQPPFRRVPISRRMQIAATRQVTREEDTAYSLMGIFDVSIVTAYGEGAERAFSRLVQEILNTSTSYFLDVFNWAGAKGASISQLLPPTPQAYLHRTSNQHLVRYNMAMKPLLLTHLGLRISILFMPALSIKNATSQMQYDPIGKYHGIVDIPFVDRYDVLGMPTGWYSVLDARISLSEPYNRKDGKIQSPAALGILNFGFSFQGSSTIKIPRSCFAVVLYGGGKVPTKVPIIFTLDERRSPKESKAVKYDRRDDNRYYCIERSDLETHGIILITMHL